MIFQISWPKQKITFSSLKNKLAGIVAFKALKPFWKVSCILPLNSMAILVMISFKETFPRMTP